MTGAADGQRDLASLVVRPYGSVVATGEVFEPYRLLDVDGGVVGSVAAFLRDVQACGRSASTLRSYGLDLLRWFRFVWAIEIALGPGDRGGGSRFLLLDSADRQAGWSALATSRRWGDGDTCGFLAAADVGAEPGDRQAGARVEVRGDDGRAL